MSRKHARELLALGQELIQGDWQDLHGEELLAVWYAAVARRRGEEIAENSQAIYGRGWYTVGVARRFPDNSIRLPEGPFKAPSWRKDRLVEEIAGLLKADALLTAKPIVDKTRIVPGRTTRMQKHPPTKCQVCRQREGVYAMQYVDGERPTFYRIGEHERALRFTRLCAECADMLKPPSVELPPLEDKE